MEKTKSVNVKRKRNTCSRSDNDARGRSPASLDGHLTERALDIGSPALTTISLDDDLLEDAK